MRKVFLIIIISVIFCHCAKNRQKEEYFAEYIVDINNPVRISFEEFITDIDTIRLEVNNESLLRDILKIRIMDDRFYIQSDQTAILIFDLTGKYIGKISDRGQGPNEYIILGNFEIDPVNERVIINDSFSRKVFIYDKNGTQIEVISLDFEPYLVASHMDGLLNFYLGQRGRHSNLKMENFNLHFLDSQGKFISSAIENELPNPVSVISFLELNCLKNGDILFHPILGNIVYKISNGDVIPYYTFNNLSKYKMLTKRGKRRFSYQLADPKGDTLKEAEDNGYILSWGAVIDLTDYVFFDFTASHRIRYLYYSKKSGNSILIEPESVRGERNFINLFMNRPKAARENTMYIAPSFHLIDEIGSNINNEKLKTFFENTGFDSNPLIISYSINFPEE